MKSGAEKCKEKQIGKIAHEIVRRSFKKEISGVALFDTASAMSKDIRHTIRTGNEARVRKLKDS